MLRKINVQGVKSRDLSSKGEVRQCNYSGLHSQSYGYASNFSPAIAMQFSEIIALPSLEKNCKLATQYNGKIY